MPCNSSLGAHCAPSPNVTLKEQGGVLDALLHYWLRRIEYADSGEARAVPEENLVGPALEPMQECLKLRGVTVPPPFADGFSFGVHAARLVFDWPLRCEPSLRGLLDAKATEMKLLAEDERQHIKRRLASGSAASDP